MRRVFLLLSLALFPSVSISTGQADILLTLESPAQDQRLSGISVLSGWVFSSVANAHLSLRVRIDGIDAGDIPCCSERADVGREFPAVPQAGLSGFGLLFNFGLLSAGSHTLTVEARDDVGSPLQQQEHVILVAKPGGFEFLSDLDLSSATSLAYADNGQEIIINEAQATDKTTNKTQKVNLHLAWQENTQTLGIVQSENVGEPTAGNADEDGDGYYPPDDCDDNNASVHPGAQEVCDDEIDNNCNGLIDSNDGTCGSNGSEQPALTVTLENPAGSLSTATVGGIGLISGWALTRTPHAQIGNVRVRIDGRSFGNIPCCSERADVQAAFTDLPQALRSGFGALINFNSLASTDSHAISVEVQDSAGITQTVENTVNIAKLGNSEFLDQFDLSTSTASLLGGTLELQNVTIRDKATQQTMQITADYSWQASCQCFMAEAGCGNGTIESGEECDGALLDGATCSSLGFRSGSLTCSPDAILMPTTVRSLASWNSKGAAVGHCSM